MRYLLLIIFLAYAPFHYAQSGWAKSKGQSYTQIGMGFFESKLHYGFDGSFAKLPASFQNRYVHLYSEIGIAKRLQLGVAWIAYGQNSYEITNTAQGIGDPKLEVKYQLNRSNSTPISFSVAPEIPLAKSKNEVQVTDAPSIRVNLPLGDGEWNVWNTLAVSHASKKLPLYASGYAAFNYRTQHAPHQLKVGGEIGASLGNALLYGKIHVIKPLSDSADHSATPLFHTDTQYTRYDVGTLYALGKQWGIGVNFSDYSNILLPRKNLMSGASVNFNVYRKID